MPPVAENLSDPPRLQANRRIRALGQHIPSIPGGIASVSAGRLKIGAKVAMLPQNAV